MAFDVTMPPPAAAMPPPATPVAVKRPAVYNKGFIDMSKAVPGPTRETFRKCISKAVQAKVITSNTIGDAGYAMNQEHVLSAEVVYTLRNPVTEKRVLASERAATMIEWLGSGLCRQARRKLLRDMKAPELETTLAELLGDFDKFNYNAKESFLKVRPRCVMLA